MRVLILTEGGRDIGFGHLIRCISLYQAFEEKGATPGLIVNGDNCIADFLEGKNYEMFNWLEQKNRLFDKLGEADIAVIDSYLADKALYDGIAGLLHIKPLVMIDDYARIEYPGGVVVNPSIYGDKLSYPGKEEITYLAGKDYIILRKEFWDPPGKIINKEVKNVLVTFGGMNHCGLTHKIINFLKKEFDFNFYFTQSDRGGFSAKEMLELMLNADICISGGGQTSYELARVGVPTIGICLAENQRFNLEAWHEKGFIEYIGWFNNENIFSNLNAAVRLFFPEREREMRSGIGKSNVDGGGARRISDKLMPGEEGLKLRKATEADCYDLWFWRNHPKVKRWSFETGGIEYEKHKKWFGIKIRDGNTHIYIAENAKGEKIGQVRFEKNAGGTAHTNVNLNPEFFGRGLGSKIIKQSSEIFMNENPDIEEIVAEIIDENIVSRSAFQKAGYVFSDNNFKNNKQAAVFKFGRVK